MAHFKNINTLGELRSQYRDLLKKHHSDNGGNEEIINDRVLREFLEKIINFDKIEIEIVGAWIWERKA